MPFNSDWNLITRTIVPVISQPEFIPGEGRTNGLGDTQFTAFLSPASPGGLIWGVGPIVQLPTNTNNLVSDKWGLGPSGVALRMDGPWVYGALVNNVWSIASGGPNGPNARPYNQFLLQPFINYNFPDGLYLSSSPIITANWKAMIIVSATTWWAMPTLPIQAVDFLAFVGWARPTIPYRLAARGPNDDQGQLEGGKGQGYLDRAPWRRCGQALRDR